MKEGVALNCAWELECALMCEFSCKCQKNVVKCRYTFYLVLRWMWLIHNIRLCLQLFVISTHIIGNLQYTKYALLWTWRYHECEMKCIRSLQYVSTNLCTYQKYTSGLWEKVFYAVFMNHHKNKMHCHSKHCWQRSQNK